MFTAFITDDDVDTTTRQQSAWYEDINANQVNDNADEIVKTVFIRRGVE